MSDQYSLPEYARGKRPTFFEDPAADVLLSMVMDLSAEVWTLKERLAVIEDLAQSKTLFSVKDIESHRLSEDRQAALNQAQSDFTNRLMRPIEQIVGGKEE